MYGQDGWITEQTRRLRRKGGAWLKKCREGAGVTQKALADHLGLAYYTTISHIESGRGRVPAEQIEQYALALGWEPAEFAKMLLLFYSPSYFRVIWGFPDGADPSFEQAGIGPGRNPA